MSGYDDNIRDMGVTRVVQYITGTPNELVVAEIKSVIEKVYPVNEGRPFISTGKIMQEINRSPESYPLLSSISQERYQKSVVTHAIKCVLDWKLFSKSRGSTSSSVFIRGSLA